MFNQTPYLIDKISILNLNISPIKHGRSAVETKEANATHLKRRAICISVYINPPPLPHATLYLPGMHRLPRERNNLRL